MQKNDYVQVDDVESVHHNKTGWVEFIDDKINTIAPVMVKFKDENGASTFREDQLKVIGTFNRENRPAELKKFRDQNTLFMATTLVNALHYEGNLPAEDVYIVWFCAALQNWKALVSTNVLDNCYYEVTHNGEKKVTYVDKYVKAEQVTVPSEMLDD